MTTISRPLSLISLLLLALPGACVDAGDDADLEFRDSGDWPCGANCTLNSPRVNDFDVPELNLDYEFNEGGVRLLGIRSPQNVAYRLDFKEAELYAKTAGGDVAASGYGLIGWRIWLETTEGDPLYINIVDYHPGAVVPLTKKGLKLSGYAMAYEVPGAEVAPLRNVCPDVLLDPSNIAVTVLGGESYDRGAVEVNPGTSRWFTLACRDEANYKMKALGYGPNFTGGTLPSTLEERQSTLKMVIADYCGDGTAHTEQGTKIKLRDAKNNVDNHPVAVDPIEAHWGPLGALCLGTPRRPEIPVECVLPVCSETPPVGTIWTTWVPNP